MPPRAQTLLGKFLDHPSYDRDFVNRLLEVARDRTREAWETRCLAALMLQYQALQIPANDVGEFDLLLTAIGLKQARQAEVAPSVLKEGYTTTELRSFVTEFRRRLARPVGCFRKLRGRRTSESDLADFLHLSARECKLALGRYLFTAEEVAERIVQQVRASAGSASAFCDEQVDVSREVEHNLAWLPDFEAAIVNRLRAAAAIYWVSEDTRSEINSLVEYPLGTVVLVVKPPGSDVEIEIKRAGRRGGRPLGVVFRRNGFMVANMHRLDGGSSAHYLRHDATMAARFSQIYRHVHQAEAPITRTLSITGKNAVPVNGSEVNLFEYFTNPEIFGDEFGDMRQAIGESIAAFQQEVGAEVSGLPGELGRTVEFLAQIPPAQAIQVGTSSFRLDLVAVYLSGEGPRRYFTEGLGVDYSPHDARRFADELLEEILGVYSPPRVEYRNHEQYLAAAFQMARNRARADRNYLSVLRQVGTFWGTLVAAGGYSNGESVVARNVGLRSVWERGKWTLKIVFMDHDSLQVSRSFDVHESLYGMYKDARFLFDPYDLMPGRGSTELLAKIFRADEDLVDRGSKALHKALRAAYRRTRAAIQKDDRLRRWFKKSHLKKSRSWEELVTSYLGIRGEPSAVEPWKARWRHQLERRGHDAAKLLELVEGYGDFLEKYSCFYVRRPRDPAGALFR